MDSNQCPDLEDPDLIWLDLDLKRVMAIRIRYLSLGVKLEFDF
jgi:hypothetical protein